MGADYDWVDAGSDPNKKFSAGRAAKLFVVVLGGGVLASLVVGCPQFLFMLHQQGQERREQERVEFADLAQAIEKGVSEGRPTGEASRRLFGQQAPRKPDSPNILVLVSDDQRPDTIAALGNTHIRTPNLDRLVRQGASFTRCVCANPICTPSRAEIMTGCSGFKNGVLDFGKSIDPGLPRWAAVLANAGYRTAYVGKWHNDGRPSRHGYQETPGLYSGGGGKWARDSTDHNGRQVTGYRGWLFQTDDGKLFPEQGVGLTPDISGKFADAAIDFLKRQRQQPFFLHVNFTAPHDPLLMPTGYDRRYQPGRLPVPGNFLAEHPFDHGNRKGRDELLLPFPRTEQAVRDELAVYYAVIEHLDAQVGRILKTLEETGQLDNTLIMYTSDHGLAVGSHGLRGKQNMYEHTMNVPLVLRGPGIPQGMRLTAQCYLRDLFPTSCALAGIAVPAQVEGQSLVPLLKGDKDSIYPHVFGYFRDQQRMVRTERWKLICYPEARRTQLFDLANDPLEKTDLSAEPGQARRVAELMTLLRQQQRDHGDSLKLE